MIMTSRPLPSLSIRVPGAFFAPIFLNLDPRLESSFALAASLAAFNSARIWFRDLFWLGFKAAAANWPLLLCLRLLHSLDFGRL